MARLLRGLAVAGCVVLTAGCGFLNALANPPDPAPDPLPTSAAAPTTAGPRVIAKVDLVAPDGRPGTLTVAVHPVRTGDPFVGTQFASDCGFPADDGTRYLPVDLTFADRGPEPSKEGNSGSNLAGTVAVRSGGDTAVFLDSYRTEDRWCQDGVRRPTEQRFGTDHIWNERYTVHAVVVARTTDDAALLGSTIELRNLRKAPDGIGTDEPWTWTIRAFQVGSPCADDPASICAPLG